MNHMTWLHTFRVFLFFLVLYHQRRFIHLQIHPFKSIRKNEYKQSSREEKVLGIKNYSKFFFFSTWMISLCCFPSLTFSKLCITWMKMIIGKVFPLFSIRSFLAVCYNEIRVLFLFRERHSIRILRILCISENN